MPRSFLVKKKEDSRSYHSYKQRDVDEDAVDSVTALTPYTPCTLPLSVMVNNGYIHDVVSPSLPQESANQAHEHEEAKVIEGPVQEYRHVHVGHEKSAIEAENKDIAANIIRQFQKNNFANGLTIGYTYDAFFVSDGRSRGSTVSTDKRGKQRYICNDCGKDYATSSNLSRHKQTHRSIDSKLAKKCPHCNKAYVSMPALSMHMLTHELKHKCDVCGKAFSRPWLLQGHFRSHTGEKPYGCAHCGKAFADRSNLRAHMQTHSAYKSYNCKRCNKSFALKSYLNKHYESACIKEDGDSSVCSDGSFIELNERKFE